MVANAPKIYVIIYTPPYINPFSFIKMPVAIHPHRPPPK